MLVNDVAGADGATIDGVRAAGGNTTTPVSGGVGTDIAGLHGTLHLNADGSYTYQSTANNIAANTTDVFVYTLKDGDGDLSTTTLTINLTDAGLVAPADNDVTVNEAALDTTTSGADLAHGTVIGSLPGSTAETDASNQLNATGNFTPLTYQLVSGGNAATAGTYGTIQVHTDGSYVYTLTSPVHGPATAGTDTVNAAESFTYQVTDANGNTTTGTINIAVIDDVPTATADIGNVNEGALLTVTAAAGVLVNDVAGADGATIDGVRAAGGNTTTPVSGGVGTDIAGLHGTLHLNADGSYTYQSTANNIAANTTDVFVYTLKDGDGDLSTTTLTINLTDAGLVAPADNDVTVNEAALDTTTSGADLAHGTVIGSLPGSTAETDATNQLNATGNFTPLTYQLVSGGNAATAGIYGTIQVHTDGSYVYTLTSPVHGPATAGTDTVNAAESFTYQVTDANGNSTTGTINIAVIDDVPTATADIGNVNEGALLTVTAAAGVLVNDVAGADGATIDGVRAAGGNTTTPVSGGVGTDIAGLHGTLHLNADGSYTYQSTANNIAANTTDVFVYTLKDGDGDLSTTTLTINLTDAGLVAPADNDVTVNEAALDTTTSGADLAHGTVIGSLPGSTAETDATNQLNATGNFTPLTYQLVSGGNAATAGIYGTIQVHTDGSYVYTLTSPVHGPATAGTDTVNAAESFTYQVTDANGNSTTGTINIAVIDDVPTATADIGNVNEGALLTVTAAAGVLVNDVAGADGATIDGVRAAGGNTTTPVSGGVGTDIAGLHGTLHLNADGSYTYQSTANNIAANTTDVFVYTLKDGDGDLSTTTLTINLTDAGLVAPADNDVTVNEAALDTTTSGADLAHGTVIGSLPGSTAETDATNQLNATGNFTPLTYQLVSGGNAATAGIYGTIQVHTDGSYVYTLTSPVHGPATAGTDTVNAAESFTYQVTDANGNSTTGTINIAVIDDVPTATADIGNVNEGALLTVTARPACWSMTWPAPTAPPSTACAPPAATPRRPYRAVSAPTLPACTAHCISTPTAPTPTSRRPTTSPPTPPTCSSTRSRTVTAICRRRR
nr:Ig-like domain-containing protein [Mesorhizobium huakuii]